MPDEQSWTWVKDEDTGHMYDVQTERLPVEGTKVAAAKPVHYGPYPRPPKHRVDLDGHPSSVATAADNHNGITTAGGV